jgi:sterol desaturase/sphingolipid hydroxylase (fatty acid hydroxylase superfamily)
MEEKYVALAIPFFMLLIAIELAVTRRAPEPRYRFADSINSLSCGVGQQVLEPFFRGAALVPYTFLYAHLRITTVSPSSVAGWVALVVLVDLGYYAFHRASHRVNLFWASHVVHHQSEEYNLSTALRQSWLEILFSWVFYLPLAVLGFSPLAVLAASTLNTLYQFWIHTRSIGKLPRWVEAWLNTPSHHRVHHGVNPKYIDKNYGGIFIVWDRLFGTFVEEDEEPVYGTVHPLASWNPLWANAHYWVEMLAMARATRRFADKARVLWAPPEWRPLDLSDGVGYVTIPEVSRATQVKYDATASRAIVAYVGAQFVVAAGAVMAMLVYAETAPAAVLVCACALVLVEAIAWGALLESKAWGAPLAIARAVVTTLAVAWFARGDARATSWTIATACVSIACVAWLVRFRAPPVGATRTA